MKPERVIPRRAPSPVTLHRDVAITICDAPLTMRLSRSAIPGYDWLVLLRCEACDAECFARHASAPAVEIQGVLPDDYVYWEDDAWGDETAYGL